MSEEYVGELVYDGSAPIPTLDMSQPIVRCRDCKHFTANKEFWIEPPEVPFPMIGATSDCCDFWAGTECKVTPDGFCAWGERRDS